MAQENDNIEVPDIEDLGKLDDSTDWKAKAEELQKKHHEAGIRNRTRTDTLKKTIAERDAKLAELLTSKPPIEEKKESTDLDYSQKAFLKASGLNTADEMKLALDFAKRTGDLLENVLEDDIFKARLEKIRTESKNADATDIRGKRGDSSSGPSVEYYLAKGEEPPKELGKEFLQKYVNARIAQGKSQKMFYDQ